MSARHAEEAGAAPAVSVRDVCFAYGANEVLHNVAFDLPPRSLTAVVGPNGGGKTTLAKLIMGLRAPTSGQILWNGEDITGLDITERAKKGISYGFQQPPRFKGIKVGDLLSIASGKKLLRRGEACAYLTQVGLCAADYIDREVDTSLSGGEVKRIEIATILARNSGLMILDEPEAGIDLWSFNKLTETFSAIHEKRDATMIIISHQERIIALADEIAVIDRGVVTKSGTVAEVFPTIAAGAATGACPAFQ